MTVAVVLCFILTKSERDMMTMMMLLVIIIW